MATRRLMSAIAAVATMLVASPLRTLAAWALRQQGGRTARQIMLSPLIVPVILNALGILFLFARIGLINTLFGLVAAHVMHAIPFVFIAAATGLESFDLSHERLARCLGATRT